MKLKIILLIVLPFLAIYFYNSLQTGIKHSSPAVFAQTNSTPTPTPPTGPLQNLILNNSFEKVPFSPPWSFNISGNATATVSRDTTTFVDGAGSAKITTTTSSSLSSDLQLKQAGITIFAGKSYKITIWAKADSARNIPVVILQSNYPYTEYLNHTLTLPSANTWQKYTYFFPASVNDSNASFAFYLADNTGSVWLDNLSMTVSYNNLESVLAILQNYGKSNPNYDLYPDNKINSLDFSRAVN